MGSLQVTVQAAVGRQGLVTDVTSCAGPTTTDRAGHQPHYALHYMLGISPGAGMARRVLRRVATRRRRETSRFQPDASRLRREKIIFLIGKCYHYDHLKAILWIVMIII